MSLVATAGTPIVSNCFANFRDRPLVLWPQRRDLAVVSSRQKQRSARSGRCTELFTAAEHLGAPRLLRTSCIRLSLPDWTRLQENRGIPYVIYVSHALLSHAVTMCPDVSVNVSCTVPELMSSHWAGFKPGQGLTKFNSGPSRDTRA